MPGGPYNNNPFHGDNIPAQEGKVSEICELCEICEIWKICKIWEI